MRTHISDLSGHNQDRDEPALSVVTVLLTIDRIDDAATSGCALGQTGIWSSNDLHLHTAKKVTAMMRIKARSKGYLKLPEDQRLVLDHARLHGQNYSGRTLRQFASIGSHLQACNFDNVQIQSAAFGSGRETSEYIECTFNGAGMNMMPGGFYRFVRCSFHNVTIRNWSCFAVELIDCQFSGRLDSAIFNGTVPEDLRAIIGRARNEFHGNDFSAMDFIDVVFRTGIDLTKQILPSGEDCLYLPHGAAAVAHAKSRVAAWDDEQMRRGAMAIIQGLEYTLSGGQQQLLLRPSDRYGISGIPRRAVDDLFALLREDGAA
jgi:hypothetical protein